MHLTEDNVRNLNHFGTPQGEEALNKLADMLYDYYAKQTILYDGDIQTRAAGAAQLAEWLKTLPKGLRNVLRSDPR